jgi:cytochrome c oxidase assembly protein subunit 15
VVLADRAAREPDAAPAGPTPRRAATPAMVGACRALVAAASVVIVTGTVVTGTGPHAGDSRADRLPLAVHTVVRVHGICVVLFLVLTLLVIRRAGRGDAAPIVTHRLHQLLVVLVAQGAIGYWQYFTGVPALLVGFHVLGAALVWIAVLRVLLAASAPEPAAEAAGYEAEPARATMGAW